jgi:dimethylhistidine N-methyltransferase
MADLNAVIELGCGNGAKLATLVRACPRRADALRLHLIDISPAALELSERALESLPHVRVTTHPAAYAEGLREAAAARPGRGAVLVLFLGSNVGNLHAAEAIGFLAEIRRALRPGDALLLGADLVKPEAELLLAYDDPLGVTAAFNKNLLARINRELGGDFDLAAFDHRATWNATASRVEMHLVSRCAQVVRVAAAGVTARFAGGETIWTESSYKYTAAGILGMAGEAGFRGARQWIDPHARFAVNLCVA